MHNFLKNILLISMSMVLLTGVLTIGVLWTYSNDIPDYKFLKNLCILIPLYLGIC